MKVTKPRLLLSASELDTNNKLKLWLQTEDMRNMPRPRDDAAGFTIHKLRSFDATATNKPHFTLKNKEMN